MVAGGVPPPTPLRRIEQSAEAGSRRESRKQESEGYAKSAANPPESHVMPKLHQHKTAAGLDIGAEEIWACVPSDRDGQLVRACGACTPDVQALADWLAQGEVRTVARESTGGMGFRSTRSWRRGGWRGI